MAQNDRTTGLVGHAGMKVPVKAASTAALVLSGEQTVDGIVLVTGDRVLVKDQASSIANGIYVVDTGDWNRAKDADGSYDIVQGSLVLVYGGTVNGNKIFKCTSADEIDVDTDALTFQAIDFELTGAARVLWCGTATGTADALVLTPTTAIAANDLQAGLTLVFKSGAAPNTGATTINVSGTGAIAVQSNGVACVGGEIEASKWYRATLDGSGAAYQLERIAPAVLLELFTAAGDLLVATADGKVARKAIGSAGFELRPVTGATGGLSWMSPRLTGAMIINGKISRTVAGNALTIAIKTLADADPSAADPVFILMPTVTGGVFDGGYAVRTISAATSVVVSSGSTLGHVSAVASPVYVYAIDNAGTIELAVSNKFFAGSSVQTSTAEGGAGASDSATTLYSTTARANVAVSCLQRWKSTQVAAGTWALTTGEVQLFPFPYKAPKVTTVTATGTFTKDWDTLRLRLYVKGGGGGGAGTTTSCNGGAGGEGEEAWKLVDQAVFTASLTVTVGTGGAGVAANTNAGGGIGNTSSIGTIVTAVGGAGGAPGNSGGAGGIGGQGGTGADYSMPGAGGMAGGHSDGTTGATNAIGGGKGGGPLSSAGVANSGGGGGSGSIAAVSGAGATGVAVITEEYV